jgi:hypothetical protein
VQPFGNLGTTERTWGALQLQQLQHIPINQSTLIYGSASSCLVWGFAAIGVYISTFSCTFVGFHDSLYNTVHRAGIEY